MNNIFKQIPDNLDKEVFEQLIQSEDVKVERIISKGHSTEPDYWYNQEQNEWVIVLQGEAILSFQAGDDIHMKAGDYVNIPAYQKHRVKWTTTDTETIWLAIHY